jgi:hypothetical protein
MLQSATNSQHPHKWEFALRPEMQMAIGRQLGAEWELPLPPALTSRDKEHDPYADIVGTC